ncbi:HAD family hydrolase [Streptomonospora salina]|uniref:Sugar-phosphatase n=1 Tax=Streptomonospora salina TaxID=104205 RepID=A0A841EDY1_9ACTN|nr:HAD family phosphatase [Streptomonospora salina]MBB5997641.1 sugar-phosphatase [Streptomonospora salina]
MTVPDTPGPRAALFDLDGTLINSEPRSLQVWSRLLDMHNVAYDESTLHRFMGRRGADVLNEDPHLFPGVTWDVLLAELQMIQADPDLPPSEELPRSVAFLHRLHAQGVPFGLVTSAGRGWADIALERMGVLAMFRGLVTAADVAEGKPDPEGYLGGARLLGEDPARVVVFEDTPAGIEAGRRAGMRVVAITTTHGPAALSRADLVVDHLTEVDWPGIGRRARPEQ